MNLIEVNGLCKNFDAFKLKDVSFSLEPGYIMGFIGRNGAGKSTTLKCMLNIMNNDGGSINLCGLSMPKDEVEIKNKVGYVFGGVDFYPESKIKQITDVTKSFYNEWNDERYKKLCERFEIDENKKFKHLSAGMKVKYSLAIAMSHNPNGYQTKHRPNDLYVQELWHNQQPMGDSSTKHSYEQSPRHRSSPHSSTAPASVYMDVGRGGEGA